MLLDFCCNLLSKLKALFQFLFIGNVFYFETWLENFEASFLHSFNHASYCSSTPTEGTEKSPNFVLRLQASYVDQKEPNVGNIKLLSVGEPTITAFVSKISHSFS